MNAIALMDAPRRVRLPGWAVVIVAVWIAGVSAVGLLEARAGIEASQLCLFRRVTGVPCATCGSTRAAFAAFEGRLIDAILLNPFVCASVAVGAVWLVLRVGFGRRFDVRLTRRQARAGWLVIAVLFALNWAWVIARGT